MNEFEKGIAGKILLARRPVYFIKESTRSEIKSVMKFQKILNGFKKRGYINLKKDTDKVSEIFKWRCVPTEKFYRAMEGF